jgi:hypothetical protein
MAKYRMHDDVVVDTDKAAQYWREDTRWDGSNVISVATGAQWEHEALYRSPRGRYYIEAWSQWQGSTPSAYWVSPQAAAAWLALNGHDIPADLAEAAQSVLD